MGKRRNHVVREDWRERGFDFTDRDVEEVDRFFDCWFEIYNLPNITAYRSREALTAIYEAGVSQLGERLPDRERKNAASVLRAGYVVAATEAKLGCRPDRDPNLTQLFELLERDDPCGQPETLAIAHWRGRHLADVAVRAVAHPEIQHEMPGFRHREAVFSHITRTLFTKLKIASWPRTHLDSSRAEAAMRLGHVIGVCEESLPDAMLITET